LSTPRRIEPFLSNNIVCQLIALFDRIFFKSNESKCNKRTVTAGGTEAASKLVKSGARVCLAACHASHQALIAAGTGLECLAPCLGRMTDDGGKDGMHERRKMQEIVNGLGSDVRILVASIRSVESLEDLATDGLDAFTFSQHAARALFLEPLTDEAAVDFEDAAKRGQS
jgi:transaldolase